MAQPLEIERTYTPPYPEARITGFAQTSRRSGEGFVGYEYVPKYTGRPYSAMIVAAERERMEHMVTEYDKTYFVMAGKGYFSIDGKQYVALKNHLITIPVGHSVGYRPARDLMRMFEFNVLPGNSDPARQPRVIPLSEKLKRLDRPGQFTAWMYLNAEDRLTYDAYYADVVGTSPPKRMLDAWRNYLVLDGRGLASLNGGKPQDLLPGMFIEIPPDNIYEYRARKIGMTLFEFNTPPSISGVSHTPADVQSVLGGTPRVT
jgi:mannose-6-phosphate isomerase-like protein (cupin superfamily)